MEETVPMKQAVNLSSVFFLTVAAEESQSGTVFCSQIYSRLVEKKMMNTPLTSTSVQGRGAHTSIFEQHYSVLFIYNRKTVNIPLLFTSFFVFARFCGNVYVW